jgi:hypothetical protein
MVHFLRYRGVFAPNIGLRFEEDYCILVLGACFPRSILRRSLGADQLAGR